MQLNPAFFVVVVDFCLHDLCNVESMTLGHWIALILPLRCINVPYYVSGTHTFTVLFSLAKSTHLLLIKGLPGIFVCF